VNNERILVVDDEPQIRRVMRTSLIANGFEVSDARDGDVALDLIRSVKFDLILLDINMPGISGIAACRELRRASDLPIIMLTVRASERDKVQAFDSGADDYVTKPFALPELLARMRSLLRRTSPRTIMSGKIIRLGEIEIDFDARRITKGQERFHLTIKEFDVLLWLAASANRTIARRELLQRVWGPDYGEEHEYLRCFVNRPRSKIEPHPHSPRYLLTEPHIGYRLELPDDSRT